MENSDTFMYPIYRDMKLTEALEKYRQYLSGLKSQATIKTYSRAIEGLIRFTGDKSVEELTFEDIMHYKSYLYSKQSLSSSVAVALSAIHGFIEFLRQIYKIKTIDIDDLKILRPKVSQKIPSYLNKAQIENIFNVCKDIEEEIIIKMLYYTGMRAGELLSLSKRDIVEIDGSLYIKVKGKGGTYRNIPVVEQLRIVLIQYFKYHELKYKNTDKLFPFTYNTLYNQLKRIAQRVGLEEITPHWLRHSCATELLSQGVDIRVIAEICGHKSLNTTMRYAKVKPQLAKEALEKLSKGENAK